MKVCANCRLTKPLDDFHNNKLSADGKAYYCKLCKKSCDQKYKSKNRKKLVETQKKYYQANREKYREYLAHYHRDPRKRLLEGHVRRARLRAGGSFTIQEWEGVLEKYGRKCLKCGATDDLSIDHIIPISRGGKNTVDNLQPLCKTCNNSKFTKIIDYRPLPALNSLVQYGLDI